MRCPSEEHPLGDQGHPEKHPVVFPQHRGYGLPTVHLLSLPLPVVGANSVACISFQFRVTNYPQTQWLEHGLSPCLWLGNSGATAPGASDTGPLVGRHLSGQPELLCRPNAWQGWRTPCPGGSLTGLLAKASVPHHTPPCPAACWPRSMVAGFPQSQTARRKHQSFVTLSWKSHAMLSVRCCAQESVLKPSTREGRQIRHHF